MATKTKPDAAALDVTPEKLTSAAVLPKFKLDRLRKDCLQLFGVTVSTFDGAVFGMTGRFTVEEVKNRIDKWKNTRVTPAKKKEAD